MRSIVASGRFTKALDAVAHVAQGRVEGGTLTEI